jgi:hypothetical protein
MTRVVVFGGRAYADRETLFLVLDQHHARREFSVLIEGEAPGADTLSREWAESRAVDVEPFPADWKKHGRAAGPIRNQQMIDQGRPDLGIAFPGGRGTADMTKRLRVAGIPVIEVL